jgi:hypothetical protein
MRKDSLPEEENKLAMRKNSLPMQEISLLPEDLYL